MPPATASRPPKVALRWIVMLAVVIVVFGGVFLVKAVFARKTNEFFDHMPQPAIAVSTYTARTERWADAGEAVGTLVAVNGTEVTTEAGGVVRRIAFDSGQKVAAGALLVELNTASEEATLKALEASARLAQVQAERWAKLGQDQLVSKDDVQQKQTAAATARAQVEAQRALIAQKTIRAPFAGVLGLRKVNLGQYVAPGSAIVSLQQLDPIDLDFTLPEQLAGRLVPGTAIEASLDTLPGRPLAGTITAVEPQVDPQTRNLTARARLRNPDGTALPGGFARVRFDLGGPRAVVVIPQTAVSFNPYGNAVFVVTKVARKPGETDMQGKPLTGEKLIVTQRFIKTGATRGDLIAVESGLKPGEQVVSSGLLKLRNDAEVTIDNSVRPAAELHPQVQNR